MNDLSHQLSVINKFTDDYFYSFIASHNNSKYLASQVEDFLISFSGQMKAEKSMLISLGKNLVYEMRKRHAYLIELCREKKVNYRNCDEVIDFLKDIELEDSELLKILALIITRFGYRV